MWPFSRNKKEEDLKTHSGNMVLKSVDGFVRVNSIDFFGPYSESPNGIFIIAWSDLTEKEALEGSGKVGKGPTY